MFEIEKIFKFEAAHKLVHHDGKCKDLHGHSYVLTVRLKTEKLVDSGPKTNMVMDFCDIDTIVKKLVNSHLDHQYLNETLQSDSTTAEFIAKWIFERLEPQIPALCAVSINETTTSKATYSRG